MQNGDDTTAPTAARAPPKRPRTTLGEARRFAQRLRKQANMLMAGQQLRGKGAFSHGGGDDDEMEEDDRTITTAIIPTLSWMHSAESVAREFRLSPPLQQQWLRDQPLTQPWVWQPEMRDLLIHLGEPERECEGARGAVLADQPGSGKTLTMIMTLLRSAQDRFRATQKRFGAPAMVVVPKRLLPQWIHQLHHHFPPGVLTVHVARAQGKGATAISSILDADLDYIRYCIDVVLTTYETLRCAMRAAIRDASASTGDGEEEEEEGEEDGEDSDDEVAPALATDLPPDHPARRRGLFGLDFRWLVGDEAVYIKNASSCNFAAMLWIRAPRRVLLTATPIPNARVSEFNSLLKALGCRLQLSASATHVDEGLRERIVKRFLVQSRIPASHWRSPLRPEVVWLDFDTDEERGNYEKSVEDMKRKYGLGDDSLQIDADAISPDFEPTAALLQSSRRRRQVLPAITMLRGICLTPLLGLTREEQEWIRAHVPDRPAFTKVAFILRYVRERMRPDEARCDLLHYCNNTTLLQSSKIPAAPRANSTVMSSNAFHPTPS